MKLSNNFSLEELTKTNTGIENIPNDAQIENLRLLAIHVLQPLRDAFGESIRINSGFRSDAVNKAVKGSPTSSHCKGEAADLDCADNARIFYIIKDTLLFDQLIWESGNDTQPDWVHVSYREYLNRRQVLRMRNGKYQILS